MSKNAVLESPRGPVAISLDDKLLDQRAVFLTDEVNRRTMADLIKEIKYLGSRDDSDKEITLYINSPGGTVSDGLALYDVLAASGSPIRTVCIGCAASMGAILFLAGEKREMFEHTRLMIHDPSYGHFDASGKKPHEIQEEVDSLNKVREKLAKIISDKTGKSLDEVYEITAADKYFDADEAIEFGLATGICKGV
ncbi:MAG: ATP-dependent Clp protease proteolytic subunit [Oscillospiraceae bacterium]|nr:ATP-dependent Clp protease proteolytic subunit [Oscillospiraceae bacterium]